MMKACTPSIRFITLFALFAPYGAQAHGFVKKIEILGSESFNGPKPGTTGANKSPIRGITDQSPIKDLQSKDLVCGIGATPGSVVASAKPGDTLIYSWGNDVAENGNWIHDTGPMMTYFAQVPTGQTADTFTGEGAKWFKTDEVGKKNNKWVQASLMSGATFKTKIPETLANGDYLVRHEIVALHNAESKGGVEFYPSCFQLRIKNSNAGNATVTATPTLSFPGAYTANDPGLLVNVFAQAPDGSEYQFPAGPIAEVTAPGATGSSPDVLISQSASLVTETNSITALSSTISGTIASTTSISTTAAVTTSLVETTPASATSTPVPTSTADLRAVRLANGRTAQALNVRFQTTTISDKCAPREPGCISGQFAVCTEAGTWSLQDACFAGTSCFAIPLKNIEGTQVGCFPESVVEQAIIDSGVGRGTETVTTPVTVTASTSGILLAPSTSSTSVTSIVQTTATVTVGSNTASLAPTRVTTNTIISSASSLSSTLPTTVSETNSGGSPAIVVGVGQKAARRMLRWERRGAC